MVKNDLFNEVPCSTQDRIVYPHFVGYLPIGLARCALRLDPLFLSGNATSKIQVCRTGLFPPLIRSNGCATTVSWTDPTTWLCGELIHSVVAEVWTHQSPLRGVASWPRPPRFLAAPRGGSSRHGPPGYARECLTGMFRPGLSCRHLCSSSHA